MQLFGNLPMERRKEVFFKEPESFNRNSERETLSYALGATLYIPAIRPDIYESIFRGKYLGLSSMVLCLEDAVGDNEVLEAEGLLCQQIIDLAEQIGTGEITEDELPLIFIRIREIKQLQRIMECLDNALGVVTGFVFPKFSTDTGHQYFDILRQFNTNLERPLYGMPILESRQILYREQRLNSLLKIKELLDSNYDLTLNIRIGATDLSSCFGIRRGSDVTIYDIVTIRDCLSDIINVFLRDESSYVVSGPVWEYFFGGDRVLKPLLRQSPFEQSYGSVGIKLREEFLNQYVDGLIREVLLDKENGLVGKTIIHPSHIRPVQSMYVVNYEEYMDAKNILLNNNGERGVFKSCHQNKMNEIKPHLAWAKKIMARSKIYGVFNKDKNFTHLLAE